MIIKRRNLRENTFVEETKKQILLTIFFVFLSICLPIVLKRLPNSNWGAAMVGGAQTSAQAQLPLASNVPILAPIPKGEGSDDLENLSAKAVKVLDLDSSTVLFEKNPEVILPIASLSKLMTAIVAYSRVGMEEVVEVKPEDVRTVNYLAGFVPGEKLQVLDLLKAMLISSANDATYVLARYSGGSVEKFVEAMNEKAIKFGMQSTSLTNPVGFDEPGNYSTASDLGRLTEEFLRYPELLDIVREANTLITSIDGSITHKLQTTNRLMLEHKEIIGLKTGYTAEAKGNLIILTDKYYSIVLGSKNREGETIKIMDWVKENYTWP